MRKHRNNRGHEEVSVVGGAAPHIGDHRLSKRVMSEEVENAGKHGLEGRRRNRTAWQRVFGYLASRGTGAPPLLTLGRGIAQYGEGAVGLWLCGGRNRKMRLNIGRGRDKRKRRTRLRLHLG